MRAIQQDAPAIWQADPLQPSRPVHALQTGPDIFFAHGNFILERLNCCERERGIEFLMFAQ